MSKTRCDAAAEPSVDQTSQTEHQIRRKPLPPKPTLQDNNNVASNTAEGRSETTGTSSDSNGLPADKPRVRAFVWPKPFFLCVFLLFTLLWIALLLLWHFARVENGLRLTVSSNHLAWTYGPTAVLVVVVGIWRQIDYTCKSSQPWMSMGGEPNTATKTILLDYIWPFQLISLVNAVKNQHFMVVCSILGFIVLKAVTLISTGLLVAIDTPVTQSAAIRYDTQFNGSQFWLANPPTPVADDGSNEEPAYFITAGGTTFTNLDSRIYYNYLVGLQGQYETETPAGFRENVAFQSFSLVNTYDKRVRWTTNVDVMTPNVSCEPAKLTYVQVPPNATTSTPYSGFNLQSQSCPSYDRNEDVHADLSAGVYRDMTKSLVLLDDGTCAQSGPTGPCTSIHPQTVYDFWRINCSSTTGPQYATDTRQTVLDAKTPFDFRIAMATVNLTFSPYVFRSSGNETTYKYQIGLENYSAVVCKVRYTIRKAELTLTGNQGYDYSLSPTIPPGKLQDLSDLQLSEIVYDVYDEAGPNALNFQPLLSILNASAAFYLNDTFEPFNLQEPLVKSLEGMTAMFMRQSYTAPTLDLGNGTITSLDTRLHTQTAVIFVMVAGLVIMSALTLIIAVLSNSSFLPKSSDTIAGNATVLASSKSLHETLATIGIASRKDLERRFTSMRFQTVRAANFRIEIFGSQTTLDTKGLARTPKLQPFTPLSVRYWMVLILLSLPIILIAALEALAQVSEREHGIFTTATQTTTSVYATRYLSTFVVFIVATLFNNLDFTIAVMMPFSALASSRQTTYRILQTNILGKTPPEAFWQSITHRQFGMMLSIVASSIGSVLTVVVSGLWVVNGIVNVQPATVSQLSDWTPRWNLSRNDNGAFQRFESSQHAHESLPSTICGDIVLPSLGSNPKTLQGTAQTDIANVSFSNFTFTVPVLRPSLACDIVPSEDIAVQYTPGANPDYALFSVSAQVELSSACRKALPKDFSQTSVNFTFSSAAFPTRYGWYGAFTDLYIGTNSSDLNSISGPLFISRSNEPGPDNPPGCPTLGVFFGFAQNRTTTQQLSRNATVLVCYQKLQKLDADVVYDGSPSDNSISTANPPRLREDTAIYIDDPPTGANPSTLRVGFLMRQTSFLKPVDGILMEDLFFNHLTSGPNATDVNDLKGSSGPRNLGLAVSRLYASYMVNVIDLNFRTTRNISTGTTSASTDGSVVSGTAQTSIYRMTIDNTSKLTLQIMLAVMVVLGILTNQLVRIRGVLPKNPCSIARTMGLLVVSKLVENGDKMSRGPGRGRKAQSGRAPGFSLGWWKSDTQLSSVVPKLVSAQRTAEDTEATALEAEGNNENMWFGIDVGDADVLGYDLKRDWMRRCRDKLRRRRKQPRRAPAV